MDIYCVKCGEPIELDYLHDADVRRAFQRLGCEALGDGPCTPTATGAARAELAALAYDDGAVRGL